MNSVYVYYHNQTRPLSYESKPHRGILKRKALPFVVVPYEVSIVMIFLHLLNYKHMKTILTRLLLWIAIFALFFFGILFIGALHPFLANGPHMSFATAMKIATDGTWLYIIAIVLALIVASVMIAVIAEIQEDHDCAVI